MQFKYLFTAALAATSVSAGVITERQANIGDLSNALKDIADSITDGITTIKDIGPDNILSIIPKLGKDFNDIANTIGQFIKEVGKIKPSDIRDIPNSDICDTYSDFFDVYNNLVDVVIGSPDGLLARIPASVITLPVAGILQVANNAINSFVYSFIQIVPNCRPRAQEELEEANKKFTDAIQDFAANVYRPIGGDFSGLGEGKSN